MNSPRRLALAFLLPLLLAAPSLAAEYLSVDARPTASEIAPGGRTSLTVRIRIHPPYHVNANPPTFDYLIPTEVKIEPAEGLRIGAPVYPQGHALAVGGFGEPIAVYDGTIEVRVPIRAADDAAPGKRALTGIVRYQACDDVSCYSPKTVPITAELTIAEPSTITQQPVDTSLRREPETISVFVMTSTGPVPIDLWSERDTFAALQGRSETPAGASVPRVDVSQMPDPTALFSGRSLWQRILFAFLGGIALNLTPCVYPLIPVTAGYFSRQSGGRRRTFLLALAYVFTLALVYAALGTTAALTGSLFGSLLQSPAVAIIMAILMVGLGLGMMGAYEIRIPSRFYEWSDSRPGFGGAALMGATMGLVAAPCIGPVIAALLAYVAAGANPAEGFSLFLALGLGLGLPYIPLALVAEAATRWPRAGAALIVVKRLLGILLFGLATWFLMPLMGFPAFRTSIGVILIGGGILMLGWKALSEKTGAFTLRMICGLALLVAGSLAFRPAPADSIAWQPYTRAAFEAAKSEGRPIIIDFTAEWCAACHELDALTFTDQAVIAEMEGVAAFKADMTGPEVASEIDALAREFSVTGLPTILFFGASGELRANLRLEGFEPADKFVSRVRELKQSP